MLEIDRKSDDGFAMIAAAVIAMVGLLLMTTVLAQGIHLANATSKDRQRVTALHVAEAGVDRAVIELQENPLYTGTGATPEVVPEGRFLSTVIHCTGKGAPTTVCPGKSHIVIDSTGTVGSANIERKRVQVILGPEPTFRYALFSDDALTVKNGSHVIGDVFSNGDVMVEVNDIIEGDVISAGGTVTLEKSEIIRNTTDPDLGGGNVYSGGRHASQGWGINLAHALVEVEGNLEARRDCPTADPPGGNSYRIEGSGVIGGDGLAFGLVETPVAGDTFAGICKQRFADRGLPKYTWSRQLYVDAYGTANVHEYTTVADFETWLNDGTNMDNLRGVHYVWEGALDSESTSVIDDLDGAIITGDFILVTNALIDAKNNLTVDAPSESTINIVSLNSSVSPASIDIKNNLDVVRESPEDPTDSDTAIAPVVLLYSEGLIVIKNNAVSTGAVYGIEIDVMNNMTLTYDERVERTVGFGESALARRSWRELAPE